MTSADCEKISTPKTPVLFHSTNPRYVDLMTLIKSYNLEITSATKAEKVLSEKQTTLRRDLISYAKVDREDPTTNLLLNYVDPPTLYTTDKFNPDVLWVHVSGVKHALTVFDIYDSSAFFDELIETARKTVETTATSLSADEVVVLTARVATLRKAADEAKVIADQARETAEECSSDAAKAHSMVKYGGSQQYSDMLTKHMFRAEEAFDRAVVVWDVIKTEAAMFEAELAAATTSQ